MASITVKLPDGKPLELDEGATGADAAAAIGPRLAKDALAVKADGELQDLSAPLPDGVEIEVDRAERTTRTRCGWCATMPPTCSPPRSPSCGPGRRSRSARRSPTASTTTSSSPTASGSSEDDLARIEEAMAAHIEADEAFERSELPVGEALERFRAEEEPYKVELIEDLVRDQGVEAVSLYRNGPFVDLCRGPHTPSTGRIKAFKLNSIAGAYWRGDESRQMLTRIYGTAFFSQKDLARHLERLEEARARDHRRLGPRAGPLHAARGGAWYALLAAQRDRAAGGWSRPRCERSSTSAATTRSGPRACSTRSCGIAPGTGTTTERTCSSPSPPSARATSARFALKPMNCPGACLVFASERHSYRELPLRLAEFGDVSRYEREGVLHGLLRVRAFTQDDAHVYCTLDQVADEVDSICEGIDELYARFGFDDVRVELSTRPQKSIGTDEEWERAERALREALERQARDYAVSPGDGDLLRPEDRLPRHRRAGPLLAVRHLPDRLPDARALRPLLPGRGQRGPSAGDDPPGAAGLDGALHRHPDRALRGSLPDLAGAGAGSRCCRSPTATTTTPPRSP